MDHSERANRRKAMATHAQQFGVASAAKKFNVHPSTVRNAASENNISLLLPGQGAGQVQTFKVLKRLLDGVPPARIAEEFSISKQRVSEIKTKAIEAGFMLD